MAFLKAAAAAAAITFAQAQDWGTVGIWEQVKAQNAGPPVSWRKPTAIAGSLIVCSNSSVTQNVNAWSFDIIANTWTQWPDISGVQIQDPYLLTLGGYVVVVDELNFNNIAVIDSSNTGLGWTLPRLTGGPAIQRIGQRFIHWGATLYMFGGADVATGLAHNDLWAVDLTGVIGGQTLTWVQVAADNTPGFPPSRLGQSWTSFEVGSMMYGGVSLLPTAPAGSTFWQCFNPATSSLCYFHQSVWGFFPGNRGPPTANSITGASWIRFNDVAAYTGPTPLGRATHTAGHMGDQLFFFGGTTANGPVNEMWAYNLVSQTFQPVTQTSPWPQTTGTDVGFGVGIVIGRSLYQYIQVRDSTGTLVPGQGQLWRWTPLPSAGAVTPIPANTPHPGTVAGLVIGVLLGIVNTGLLVVLAQNAGALPAMGGLACLSFGGSRKPTAGYYSSVAPDASHEYVAPA